MTPELERQLYWARADFVGEDDLLEAVIQAIRWGQITRLEDGRYVPGPLADVPVGSA